MPKKDDLYDVHRSLDDEKNGGLVWFRDPMLQSMESRRVIVRITAKTGRSVFCEALFADSRFMEKWCSIWKIPSYPIAPADTNLAFISQWYRSKLGIDPLPQQLQVEYLESLTPLAWQVFACLDHPQIIVRFGAALGLIGLAMGVGLALGAVSELSGILPLSK
jgi:hypothetical protein